VCIDQLRCADSPILIAPEFIYSLFGLSIRSNVGLPEISSVQVTHQDSRDRHRTVAIQLGSSPGEFELPAGSPEVLRYETEDRDSVGIPALRIWSVAGGGLLRLEYFDGTQFWLDRAGTRIWSTWPENLSIEDTATYLLGPVLGLLLRLRGVTCLHASAVSIGGGVVAFVGPEGAGKSTTAAALAQQGCAIVSDDVVALTESEGSFSVYPAYPYLCLWPESVESIYGSADALPRFSGNYEKRCLSLEKQKLKFESRVLPLTAIYVLGERRANAAPILKTMGAQRGILALVANTFATNVLDDAMRAREFETLGRLVPGIRIREVLASNDVRQLPDLCQLILEDVEQMNRN
jgi:hypothetical protein